MGESPASAKGSAFEMQNNLFLFGPAASSFSNQPNTEQLLQDVLLFF